MQPSHRPHGVGKLFLADQWDRVDRDPLAADVVPVRLGDRSLRHHADLGAAPDHDHALAVDHLEGRHDGDLGDALHRLEVADQPGRVRSTRDLELQLGHRLAPGSTRDIGDVRAVTEDGLGEAIQDAWLVAALNQQARNVCCCHGRER